MIRVSAAARYLQVKQFVLDRLGDGSLKAGARVPSENELVRELEVSRMTANRALRELAAEGLLVRVAGVGTFVAEQRVHSHPLAVRSIADEIRERGHRHTMRLISKGAVAATPDLAERCGVATGARLDHSLIVHYEDAVPLQVEDRYVNPVVIRGYLRNDFARVTPHDFLMEAAPLQRAEHTVRAVAADARIRRLLKLAPHEPCLLILRRTWARGSIATVAELHYPGSRYELTGAFHQRPRNP
jgi:GntR family histidine utilization transcriptional repressor